MSEKDCPVFDYETVLNLNHLGYMESKENRPRFNLQIFDKGPEVEVLQRGLNRFLAEERDHDLLMIDGTFGQMTHLIVIRFQKAKGLEPDGIVGPHTRLKLPSRPAI